MKKTSQKRLTLERETVRSLVGELERGQLPNPTNLSLVC